MNKIQINNPCTENWNAMKPGSQGRFCSSCCKTVVDFTKKNRTEIDTYFASRPEEEICGRYKITIAKPLNPKRRKFSFSGKLVAFFVLIGAYLFSTGCYVMGKRASDIDAYKFDRTGIPNQHSTSDSTSHFSPEKKVIK
jgi:hypothetical protein